MWDAVTTCSQGSTVMFRIIQGEKGKEGKKKEFDPEFDQGLESDELENAQRYQFDHLTFKQKLKVMRGEDVSQWADDTIKNVINFHNQYHDYQDGVSYLRSVSKENND